MLLVARAAPFRYGNIRNSNLSSLRGEHYAQVDVPWALPLCGQTQSFHHFRTHFILIAGNPYTTMHYDIERLTTHTTG